MNLKRKNKGLLTALTLMLLLGGMLQNDAAMPVLAGPAGTFSIEVDTDSAFSIDAEVLPSDRKTYSVRITVENQGEDWEGTVRLVVEEDYRTPCAYDTALSLPQGSRKQFVVTIPINSVNSSNGTVNVTLLDRRGDETVKKRFNRLLAGQLEALSMGILSDAYGKLTYLDMGGEEIYFYDDFYPIRLVELQQGDLENELEALTFLVIDQYNTGILTDEEMDAIHSWNLAGGVLIVGTGSYVEDTLDGMDTMYLGIINYKNTYTPEDASDFDAGPSADWTKLTMAEIEGMYGVNADYDTGGLSGAKGDGSSCVLPYSLTELGEAGNIYQNTDQTDFVMRILEDAGSYANSRYSSNSSYSDNSGSVRSLLSAMGNSNSVLRFGVLKVIVFLYVIFAGPVLYLILRFMKRRELYWAAVPVTALLGIGLIFLAGRDFKVVSTRVYTVSVQNLSDSSDGGVYMYCYDAGRREWDLRLVESVAYVGPLGETSYYGIPDDGSYYYHISREGDIYSLGIKPRTNFEDSYFYLSSTLGRGAVEGSIQMQGITADANGIKGTVVNDTNQDMDYFTVYCNNSLYVFEDLPAGAARRLEDSSPLFESNGYYYSAFLYRFLDSFYLNGNNRKSSALAALGVGINSILPQMDEDEVIVMGVVEDWDKMVDDTCNEISYGCFYSIQ